MHEQNAPSPLFHFLVLFILFFAMYAIYTLIKNKREINAHRNPYIGIRGWMFLFIVIQIITGLRIILVIIEELVEVRKNPLLATGVYFELFIFIILLALICYGLHSIMTIKENAIKTIKLVIVIVPLLTAINPILTFLIFALTIDGFAIDGDLMMSLYDDETRLRTIGSFISSAIWYRYFTVSVRVKTTWEHYHPKKAGPIPAQPDAVIT